MKIGCIGCLVVIIGILVLVVAAAGFFFMSTNIYHAPDVAPATFTRGDGQSAQRKLSEVVLRQTGRSSRQDPIVLSEREANAFLAHHLAESARLPFDPLVVKFTRGEMQIQGRTPARNLLQAPPFAQILPYLGQRRMEEPIWVSARAQLMIEPAPAGSSKSYVKVEFTELALGKQPLGAWLTYLILGRSGGIFRRWQVPGVVTDVEIEDGRAIIRTR